MNLRLICASVLIVMLFTPAALLAGKWQGTIQGLQCATTGKVCPVGYEDPLIHAEENFVLLQENGSRCLLPNLSRGILARHINDKIVVLGEQDHKYKSLHVEKLKVYENGEYKTVWSEEMQEKYRKMIHQPQ